MNRTLHCLNKEDDREKYFPLSYRTLYKASVQQHLMLIVNVKSNINDAINNINMIVVVVAELKKPQLTVMLLPKDGRENTLCCEIQTLDC